MLTGDFEKLASLIAATEKLGRSAMSTMGMSLAEEAHTQAMLGFAESRAPDGAAWAPLKVRDGQPLRDTRRMNNSITQSGSAKGISLGIGAMYAAVHQHGATITPKTAKMLRFRTAGGYAYAKRVTIPARPMLPESGSVPAIWAQAFHEAADETLDMLLGGAAKAAQ